MGEAPKEMTGFLVLAFILGHFIALFNWYGICSWIAVGRAGMWTIKAAIFVPRLGLIGFETSFVQAAFRIRDSATQVITPMNPRSCSWDWCGTTSRRPA